MIQGNCSKRIHDDGCIERNAGTTRNVNRRKRKSDRSRRRKSGKRCSAAPREKIQENNFPDAKHRRRRTYSQSFLRIHIPEEKKKGNENEMFTSLLSRACFVIESSTINISSLVQTQTSPLSITTRIRLAFAKQMWSLTSHCYTHTHIHRQTKSKISKYPPPLDCIGLCEAKRVNERSERRSI